MSSTDSARPGWITELLAVVGDTYVNWRDSRTIRLGAGIAYYGLFAIVPLVTLSVVVAQLLVDEQAVTDFFREVGDRLNIQDEAIATFLAEIDTGATQASLGVVGFGSLVFAAALVFFAVQDAFDEVWGLPVRRGKEKILRRLTAFVVVGGGGIIIVLGLVINTVSGLIEYLIPGQDTLLDRVPDLFSVVSGWAVLIGMLIVVYQVLTRPRLGWFALIAGSVATALLLAVGTWVLGLYLRNYASASVAGAFGSVILVLLWLYYTAQMILVGAHLIRVLDERHPRMPPPRSQPGSV